MQREEEGSFEWLPESIESEEGEKESILVSLAGVSMTTCFAFLIKIPTGYKN